MMTRAMTDADKILREQTIPALRGSGGDGHADAIEHLLAEAVQLRAEVERLRANMKLVNEGHHHCSNCGVILSCAGSHRSHEWEWHRRVEAALAKLRSAIRVCRSDSARAAMRDVYEALGGHDE